ncbi:hypothetical protein [Blautia producta]|uniref:hypothetical protein n=1 Tax=Blautia producta TaxID=33035 RepID=UPI003CCC5CF2
MGKEMFSEELKLAVVRYVLEGHTRKEASEKFCVSCTPSYLTVTKEGAQGLMKKQITKGVEKRQKKQEQAELQKENKRLAEENYQLRMENDYLKKLNALIQKRERPE